MSPCVPKTRTGIVMEDQSPSICIGTEKLAIYF
jgi:hypothetical protein